MGWLKHPAMFQPVSHATPEQLALLGTLTFHQVKLKLAS